MSNLVYPKLPGISSTVGRIIVPPKVDIRTTPSEREFRSRSASLPRYQYQLAYNFLHSDAARAQLQQLVGFYNQHGGPFESWLFDDVDDNTATDALIGVGNGSTTAWQLLRPYGGFSEPVTAPKLFPDVKVNGAAVNLVPNGSFEDNPTTTLATGWQAYAFGSTGTVTYSQTGWSVDGGVGQFANASALAAGAGNVIGVYRPDLVGPFSGQQFTFGASFLVSYGHRINLYVDWYNAAGTFLGGRVEQVTSAGVPVRVWLPATAPVGAARAALYLYADLGNGGAVDFRVDAAQMQVGPGPESYSPNVLTLGADGRLSFAAPVPAGQSITWSGEFYRRCRFLGDRLDTQRFMRRLFEAKRVEFITVKGQ